MMYKPNTAFMDLYEELSALNEEQFSSAAVISRSMVDASTVSQIVKEQQALFDSVCKDFNQSINFNNFVTAHSTFLCMPDQFINGMAVNVVHTTLTQAGFDWRALDENGATIDKNKKVPDLKTFTDPSNKNKKTLPNCTFDLSKSWLFFNVSGAFLNRGKGLGYSAEDIYFELIKRMPVDETSAKMVKMDKNNALSKTVVHSQANFSIGIPFGDDAGDSISLAFSKKIKDSDDVKAAQQDAKKRRDLAREKRKAAMDALRGEYDNILLRKVYNAIAFIKDFIGRNYRCTLPVGLTVDDIVSESDIRNIAFHTEDLVEYALSSNHNRAGLLALLSIFNVKLHSEHKSVQYLHNAHKQEDILATYGMGILERNHEATRLPEGFNVPDTELYKYLVPKHCVTDAPDFKYTSNTKILIDAKIYANSSSAKRHSNPSDRSTHNAHFLIAYIKYPKDKSAHWELIDLQRSSLSSENRSAAKYELESLIHDLNNRGITLNLVEAKDLA